MELNTVTGTTSLAKTLLVPTNALKSWWNNSWNSTQGIGQYYPDLDGVGGVMIRGGCYNTGSSVTAGIFSATLNIVSSVPNIAIGFRCVYRKAP